MSTYQFVQVTAAEAHQEDDFCGHYDWSLDGAGALMALGEEGRRGAAPWVDLRRQRQNNNHYFSPLFLVSLCPVFCPLRHSGRS